MIHRTVARSRLAASPPIPAHAKSAQSHATVTQWRHVLNQAHKSPPTRIPSPALTAHNLGDPGHRPAIAMPAANAARIHNVGNFMAIATPAECRDSR
jgi:hypothetical protein